jgi:hypothetical protein
VRKAGPSIRWRIQCYHYRTEAYCATQMDGAGNKQMQNYNRQVRHNTHSAWAIYTPYYWEDISSPFPDIGSASLTRLTFEKEFVFADDESRSHFRNAKEQFIETNRKDLHYEFSEVFDMPGFQRHVLACKDSNQMPWWLTKWCYYIASALCLTIPFRLIFTRMCCEIPKYRCTHLTILFILSARRPSIRSSAAKTAPLTPQWWRCRYQAVLLASDDGYRMSGTGTHRLHYYHASRSSRAIAACNCRTLRR